MRLNLQTNIYVTALGLILLSATVVPAEQRRAFVVGENSYPNLSADMQLSRAVNDARSLESSLKSIGFIVTRVNERAELKTIISRFNDFLQTVNKDDTVVFYFAGHGVSIDNQNYLIPSDIPNLNAGGESVVRKLAIAENDLISEVQTKGARVSIFIIDACRNNPFPKNNTRSLGQSRGLTGREPPQGVFSIYSAGSGQQALDRLSSSDDNRNSVFTRILIKEIVRKDNNLLDLGENIREEVASLAKSVDFDQVPAVYNQILGARRIYLGGGNEPTKIDLQKEDKTLLSERCNSLTSGYRSGPHPPVVWGVSIPDDKIGIALRTCQQAVAENPENAVALYNLGLAYISAGENPEAIKQFEKGHKLQNLDATFILGTFLLRGSKDVAPDEARSFKLFRQAAERGLKEAMNEIGAFYQYGNEPIIRRDDGQAVYWYLRAARLYDTEAMIALGHLTLEGRGGLPKDVNAAREWFKKAADAGHSSGATFVKQIDDGTLK